VTAFDGVLFDGIRAAGLPVRVDAQGTEVLITSATGTSRVIDRDQIRADVPIPGVFRRLRLPGGELIETTDGDAVTSLWPPTDIISRAAFAIESRWWAVLTGLALTAGAVWLIVAYVLPLAAKPVATRISPRVEAFMGKQTLAALDRTVFSPSTLSDDEAQKRRDAFAAFIEGEDVQPYRIEFRHAGTPNALALPGGIIVVTDEMVQTTANDAEFLAVVAHEMGHVHGHHAMRLVLQSSGLAVLMTALAGDAVGTTILAAAVPAILLRTRYSRQFESEADDYAFALLKRHGRSPQAFADLLRRLSLDAREPVDAHSLRQYLSTHPATEDRIRRAEEQR
jgi:Zn-dependent protease with chaperone function